LRSLAAIEPKFGVVQALDSSLADVVVHCLCCHAESSPVQRWGLAALGALVIRNPAMTVHVAKDAATCVAWALGSDALDDDAEVEKEALFCAHALCSTEQGCVQLTLHDAPIARLAAGAVTRRVRHSLGAAEACIWGMRVLERLAGCRKTFHSVEPYAGIIVDTILSPQCQVQTALAGAAAISHLASSSSRTVELLVQHRMHLVKALQRRARMAVEADEGGPLGHTQERELHDWAKVLTEMLADVHAFIEKERNDEEEDEEANHEDAEDQTSRKTSHSRQTSKLEVSSRRTTKLEDDSSGAGRKSFRK